MDFSVEPSGDGTHTGQCYSSWHLHSTLYCTTSLYSLCVGCCERNKVDLVKRITVNYHSPHHIVFIHLIVTSSIPRLNDQAAEDCVCLRESLCVNVCARWLERLCLWTLCMCLCVHLHPHLLVYKLTSVI